MTRSKHHIHSIVGDFVVTRTRFPWLHPPCLPSLVRQSRILALLMLFLEQNHIKEVATIGAKFPLLRSSMLERPLAAPPAMKLVQMKGWEGGLHF